MGVSKLCGVEQTAPSIFGRAAITLGIGAHSSFSTPVYARSFSQFVFILCCYFAEINIHINKLISFAIRFLKDYIVRVLDHVALVK